MEEEKQEIKNIYIDGVTLNYGPYDFSILGTKMNRSLNNEGVVCENQNLETVIRVSPQLAKALGKILNAAVASYEEQYGMIPDTLDKMSATQESDGKE